jgi:hydrogenase large subunit
MSMGRVTLDIDLNRVEGDLEFQLDLEDGIVVDARCIGTMYRGFEQIMIGRAPRDALVITPRICGICGTAHLYAAVRALENLAGIKPPMHAVHVRNLCLMAENLQSDLRQSFLFFTPDLCNPAYAAQPMAGEIAEAFTPMQGSVVRGCLRVTRHVVAIVALFGGQWPHSTYMLPGGISQPATSRRLMDAGDILDEARSWFEADVLGGMNLDHWLALDSADALFAWLESRESHARSALGLFTRFARAIGLHRVGRGSGNMLSYGVNCSPDTGECDMPAGFYDADRGMVEPLDTMRINEHVRHSWFLDYPGGRHPWQGETIPDYQPGTERYSWAKAPRYGDKVAQTGPLAELRIAGDPLIVDLLKSEGDSAWLRQFARLRRAAWTLRAMREHLSRLGGCLDEPHFIDPNIAIWPDGESHGLVEAARGALGHWLRIRDGVIDKYQIVTPTAWNASPRDSMDQLGHWEQSVIGLRIEDPKNPVEIGHIVRSHDPCLVCTVHCIGHGKRSYAV